jgi:hypothetical protein
MLLKNQTAGYFFGRKRPRPLRQRRPKTGLLPECFLWSKAAQAPCDNAVKDGTFAGLLPWSKTTPALATTPSNACFGG